MNYNYAKHAEKRKKSSLDGSSARPRSAKLPPLSVMRKRSAGKRAADPATIDYTAYLASSEWQKKRLQALERSHHQCQRCDARKDLQVHHLTYVRLGREALTDLVVLCSECHKEEHDLK